MDKQHSFFHRFSPIIFFVTAIPLLVMGGLFVYFLSHYNMNETAAEELKTEAELLIEDTENVERFVQIPTGEIAVFTWQPHDFVLIEWQPETNDIQHTYSIDSDVFNRLFVIYQPNGIVFATVNNGNVLQLYSYEFGTEPTKIEHSPIIIDTFLEQSTLVFNNQLFFIGKNEADDFIALVVQDEQVETINFSQMPQLQHIIHSDFHNFSYTDIDYPIVKLMTYNRDDYFINLDPQANQNILQFEDETQSEIETRLLEPYGEMEAALLTIEDIPISQNLFYPKLYYLADDLILIVGANGVREDDSASGYLLNGTGEEIIKSIPDSDIWTGYDGNDFHVQFLEQTNTLYVSTNEQAGVIALDKDAPHLLGLADYQVAIDLEAAEKIEQADQLLEEGAQFSFSKMGSFIQNNIAGTVLVMNFLIFLSVPTIIFGFMYLPKQRARRQIEKAYANGGRSLMGTITNIQQTGVLINDQPQVNLAIHFVYNGRTKNNNLKMIADLVQPPQVGDQIEIIYDPVRNKIFSVPTE